MAYRNLLFDVTERIATLTINRPQCLNALDPETMRELESCIAGIAADASARCLIVSGAGDKAFVAGADIGAMREMSPFDEKRFAAHGLAVLRSLETLPIPVIAAVNGYALGGGTELALACDFIVASTNARFGLPEVTLGIIPGFGGTQRLARRIGLPRAREMIFCGEMIDADAAMRCGLVNHVVPAAELIPHSRALAARMAARAPIAIAQAKAAINAGIEMDLDNALRFETEAVALTFATEDKREGMAAFLQKRAPHFTGR